MTYSGPLQQFTVNANPGDKVRIAVTEQSGAPTVPVTVTAPAGESAVSGMAMGSGEMTRPAAGAAATVTFDFGLAPGQFTIRADNLTLGQQAQIEDGATRNVDVFDYTDFPFSIEVDFL